MFAGIFFGYAAYYFVRANFDLAQPGLIQAGFVLKSGIRCYRLSGWSCLRFIKFVMAGMSDRS